MLFDFRELGWLVQTLLQRLNVTDLKGRCHNFNQHKVLNGKKTITM